MYRHWFEDCPDHDACIRHVGEGSNENGPYRTESHAPAEICPGHRLNLDYPVCDDRCDSRPEHKRAEWTSPRGCCADKLGHDHDSLVALEDAASLKGLRTPDRGTRATDVQGEPEAKRNLLGSLARLF